MAKEMASQNTPEPYLDELQKILDRIVSLHRQLLENVKMERVALANADLSSIQELSQSKQAIIDHVRKVEDERIALIRRMAAAFFKDENNPPSLENIAIWAEGFSTERAKRIKSTHQALRLMLDLVIEKNHENAALVERSLENIGEMKKNLLGETVPKSTLYDQKGKRSGGIHGARMISKEA